MLACDCVLLLKKTAVSFFEPSAASYESASAYHIFAYSCERSLSL